MNRKKPSLKCLTGFTLKTCSLLILLVMIQLFTGTTLLSGESPAKAVLETIRAGRHGDYSSVVFEFKNPFRFDPPMVHDAEVHLRLKTVKTTLAAYREYKNAQAWVRLEKAENDLDVRMGLLNHFLKFSCFVLKNPDRLVINLYRDDRPRVFSSETTGADPEDRIEPALTMGKYPLPAKAPEDRDRQTEKTTPPENSTVLVQPVPAVLKGKSPAIIDAVSKPQLLTMNFFQGDIQEILSGLAIQQKTNIVTSTDVSGQVSVHLYQVPFDSALDVICRAGGFSYDKRGDVYYVFKPKDTAEPEAERLKLRIFKLEYADMDKIQEVLDAIPGIRMIKIHEPSKSIIVEDTPENIAKIELLVRFWDAKPKQVMIEAKILEVDLTDDMAMGVNWEKILGDVRIGTGGFGTAIMPGDTGISPIPATGTGIFGNIITSVGTRHQFAAALDALQTKTRINTLSTPKILAIHSKPAKVQVGGQQGYAVTTVSDGIATTSIEFIDTGTILEITPYIDHKNNVLLKVQPQINSARIEEGGIPVVKSTQVTTWLSAKNGETVFIGGLIQTTKTETQNSVPCLGDIPGLNLLFGRASHGTGKSELIILITSRVLDDGTRSGQDAIEKINEIEKGFKDRSLSPLDLVKPLTP
jgi:type IV pilus secretin PilQ/predicted competence protein